MQKVIEKIHRKFDNAEEKILAEAKQIIATHKKKDLLKRLEDVGFSQAEPVKKAKEVRRSEQLVELIESYRVTFPTYKFITEEIVNKICEKYGLVFSFADNYIGDIPEKNLTEIEQFVKRNNIEVEKPVTYDVGNGIITFNISSFSFWGQRSDEFSEPHTKKFKIVAPEKDFETKNKVKKGYELIDDPIVLWPVKGGYIIVTKWGLEANDESLINETNN